MLKISRPAVLCIFFSLILVSKSTGGLEVRYSEGIPDNFGNVISVQEIVESPEDGILGAPVPLSALMIPGGRVKVEK